MLKSPDLILSLKPQNEDISIIGHPQLVAAPKYPQPSPLSPNSASGIYIYMYLYNVHVCIYVYRIMYRKAHASISTLKWPGKCPDACLNGCPTCNADCIGPLTATHKYGLGRVVSSEWLKMEFNL